MESGRFLPVCHVSDRHCGYQVRRHCNSPNSTIAKTCSLPLKLWHCIRPSGKLEVLCTCWRIKSSWEQHRATSALQAILARGIRTKMRGAVKVCRNPGDDMFLECAALAKADLLVAGDKDLLTLGVYEGTRSVTPSEYLRAS